MQQFILSNTYRPDYAYNKGSLALILTHFPVERKETLTLSWIVGLHRESLSASSKTRGEDFAGRK